MKFPGITSKNILIGFAAAALLAMLAFVLAESEILVHPRMESVDLSMPDGAILQAQIAATEQERERGLMSRSSLCGQCGMLFVFGESGVHGFWMKNTLIPLDAIFMDDNFRVVDVLQMEPCPLQAVDCPVYTANASSAYVLEANQGFARMHNVTAGSRIIVLGLQS